MILDKNEKSFIVMKKILQKNVGNMKSDRVLLRNI